ncbi:MAG: protein kinase domain-containing protein [Rhodanobacteraceae bacterium]
MTDPTPTLRELFESALALTPGQRGAFLDARCPDPAQRAAVERLLAADEAEDAHLIDRPFENLLGGVGDAEAESSAPPAGSAVGPFTLLEKLGEGGSSIVFRAERVQEGVAQRVALKLLRRGLYSQDEQRRFRLERTALAQLRHPGIARLIEGGVTDTGVPYIALELIDGEPITDHARNRQLGLRARVALFVSVCRAVEAAHRALIVHRDLKPSNVLVTTDGDVKLLDFGIAKLLDANGEGTHTQHQAMTPAYAAPEQFNLGQITTATDVYALGVLLGELMTGMRREHGDTRTPSSSISEHTDPAALPAPPNVTRRQLRGDLDNIVLKATEAEPERRYASAGAFADDIERYLAGQPVAAHPPSQWYRTRKFVARHRGGVVTTAAFLLAIFAALGIALWQANVARQQAHIAQEQAQRAQAVRDLLVDLFDAEIPSRPDDEMPGTAELLERGAQRANTELSAVPAVQSDLLTALGRVYDHLALPEKGQPLLDNAIAAARRVDPPDPALLGAALSERGELELSSDRFAPAIALFDEAIPLQRKAEPDGLALAITFDRRALAQSQTGKHAQAIVDYETALAIRRARLPADDGAIFESYNALGNALTRAGDPARAAEYLRKAVDGAQAKFGERHVKTAHYLKNYATTQGMLRNYTEAAALTERAVAIERTLYPKGSPDVVNGLNNLGNMNLTLGRLHAARDALEEGRSINREAGENESLGQTFVLGNLARVNEILGERAVAIALLREAEGTATKVVGAEHPRTVSLHLQRTRAEFDGSAATATALAGISEQILAKPEALAQFRARTEPEAGYSLGMAYGALHRDAEAERTLQQTVDRLPADHIDPLLIPAVVALADWQRTHGDDAAAVALLNGYIERSKRELATSHYALGLLYLTLAETEAITQPAQAQQHVAAAMVAFAELPATHPWRLRAQAVNGGAKI